MKNNYAAFLYQLLNDITIMLQKLYINVTRESIVRNLLLK